MVKSVKFKDYKYVGDPINAVRIFNDKEVNELVLIDIDASREKRTPDIKHITNIASEAFMPVAYGGGISNSNQVKEIFYNGVEKVIFNTAALPMITKSGTFSTHSRTKSDPVTNTPKESRGGGL